MKKQLLSLLLFLSPGLAFTQGISLPYYTGFDSPSELAGWQQFRTGFLSIYSWGAGGSLGFSGGCLSHDYNVGGNSNDTVVDWYVSPPLNISAQSKIALKVHTSGFSTPFPDNCEIWFGTGSPDPTIGSFTLLANLSYMLPQFTWLDTVVNISSITDSGYIAFKYKTIGAAWSTYRIDNITVSVDSAVSVRNPDEPDGNLFSIYPNPFFNSTSIFLDEFLSASSLDISICNVFGEEVRKFSGMFNRELMVYRENLNDGIYFIRLIKDGKMIATRKVVIR